MCPTKREAKRAGYVALLGGDRSVIAPRSLRFVRRSVKGPARRLQLWSNFPRPIRMSLRIGLRPVRQARNSSTPFMKTPKLFSLLFAMSALFVAAGQAQDQTTPPSEGRRGKGGSTQGRGQMMSPEARVEQLDKAVTLTEEQKTKIKEIYTKAQEDMRAAFRGGGGGDRDAAREKMMEAMRRTREQVRALLTDEQKTKFDAMPQRGAGDQGGRKGKRDGKTQ